MDSPYRLDPIDYLVHRKHPILHGFGAVPIRNGSPLSELYEKIEQFDADVVAFRKELLTKSDAEIAKLVEIEKEKEQAKTEQHLFFNEPSAAADFDHYCRADHWTLDECVALSLGKDPKRTNWNSVQGYLRISRFAKDYEKLRDLVERAAEVGQLSDPVRPCSYLAWAKEKKIALSAELFSRAVNSDLFAESWPERLHRQLAEAEVQTRMYKQVAEDLRSALKDAHAKIESLLQLRNTPQVDLTSKPSSTKERDSLLKLSIGMAIGGYRYDPYQTRNAATREIRDDLQALGLGMDDDTIRKYLKQGGELIPRDALENLKR